MILLLMELSQINFNTETANSLIDDLLYFTNSRLISGLISACLAENREHRPSLMEVVDVLKQYRGLASINGEVLLAKKELKNPQREEMIAFVEKAIAGLSSARVMTEARLWSSLSNRRDNWVGNEQLERTYKCGFFSGMAGVLFVLAKARECGLNIGPCLHGYDAARIFIEEYIVEKGDKLMPGLFEGSTGIAIAISSGMMNKLWPKNEETI